MKMHISLQFVIFLSFFVVYGFGQSTSSTECSGVKADIVFLLDSSSSEGATHFATQLEFVSNYSSRFSIGPNAVHIGLVTYSNRPQNQFWLNTYSNLSDVISAIQNVPYTPGGTSTSQALKFVKENSFTTKHGSRIGVPKVLIVLTDGQSQAPIHTAAEADSLHQANIRVISIGIGRSVVRDELEKIATDNGHVFTVENFSGLKNIEMDLEKQTCKDEKPLSACSGVKADIVFLLDSSSSEGATHFATQLQFVSNYSSRFFIGPNQVQFGLVTFSSRAQNQFWLNTYSNLSDVTTAIQNVPYTPGGTSTAKALKFVRENSFTTAHGSRNGVPKVLIVLTDGQSQHPIQTATEAKTLHQEDIKVISIGVGNSVIIDELESIATDRGHVFAVDNFSGLKDIEISLENKTCKDEKPLSECGENQADIVFVLDSSASEGRVNFHKQIVFVKDFVKRYKIGPQNVQVGLVTFSTAAHNEFYFNSFSDRASLLAKLDSIKYRDGSTHTDSGLMYARLYHTDNHQHGKRLNATQIVIVLTDGQSSDSSRTATEAKLLHKVGAKVFAIGIGNSVNAHELQAIADSPHHVFQVSGFDALNTVEHELNNQACVVPTSPPTIDKECGTKPADIYFLLDSSGSISRENYHKQLEFVKSFASQYVIGPSNIQIGIATFSTSVHERIRLDQYNSSSSLLVEIPFVPYDPGTTHTHDALAFARLNAFTHGGRPHAQKIVVVLTDGKSIIPSFTVREANKLKVIPGIKVISIGIGDLVDNRELLHIASDSAHSFTVAGFDSLEAIKSEISFAACQTCGFIHRADIVFAIDASSSESKTDFQNELNFVSRFVNDMPVGPNNVQFGLVTFGTSAHKEFFLNQYSDKQSVLNAIQKATYISGTTATGDALRMIRQQYLLSKNGARSNSKHFVIVLTDGASTNEVLTASEAALLKQENVIVIAIGVGTGIDKTELQTIATDSRHVFNTSDFQTLQQIQQKVKSTTCDAISTSSPVTTIQLTTEQQTTIRHTAKYKELQTISGLRVTPAF